MSGLGFGRRRLIKDIITQNWKTDDPEKLNFKYGEMLFIIQEMLDEEGKHYMEPRTTLRGHQIFRDFVAHLLYRNIANYDSMLLLTSDKGCITGDALLEMPRDLKKYPRGIPLKELVNKGPIHVYCFNKESKKLELKKCDGVEFVKNADVWEVELTNGMKIKATEDHPFLQIDGNYKQLKDLHHHCKIYSGGKKDYGRYMSGGKLIYTDRLRLFCRPNIYDPNDNRIKIDYSDIDRKNGDTPFKHTEIEHRFIMQQLGYKTKGKIVHHDNGIHYDNNITNLKIFDSQSEHHIHHGMDKYHFKPNNIFCYNTGYSTKKKIKIKNNTEEFNNQCREKRNNYCKKNSHLISEMAIKREQNNINSNHIKTGGVIKSIKYIGKEDVFDVVNVQDNHNFIVNGFVVSNTGKSSAAIMLAREWCRLIGIRFNPARHIAYTNADMMNKIDQLNKFEPLVADEAVRFASSAEWAKKENKELKKKIAEVRTKHLFFLLCFPLKIHKLEKTYLESFTNYWVDLFARGKGAIYVKDKNPTGDSWKMNAFKNMGSYTEFTLLSKVRDKLKKHPNFWQIIKFPKPPAWLYERYMKVREKNVYDDENVMASMSKEDIHRALLILSLRDIMRDDVMLSMNRVILHIKNQYDINITKGMVQSAIEDSKLLVNKIREQAMQI